MGLFKSVEEKAAAKEQKEKDRFLRSPVGRATTAHSRGDSIFEVAFPVDDDGSSTLSDIEAIGWRLDAASYAYRLNLSSTSNMEGQLSDIYSQEVLTGVYLFRRP